MAIEAERGLLTQRWYITCKKPGHDDQNEMTNTVQGLHYCSVKLHRRS